MIKKLSVKYYKCLVGFEIKFNKLTLLLGPNGSGKSSILEILDKIRRLVIEGDKVKEIFHYEDITQWREKNEELQVFGIVVKSEMGEYRYELLIRHNPYNETAKIEGETLLFEEKVISDYKYGQVYLYDDDYAKVNDYPFDPEISSLVNQLPNSKNKKITWFKEWLENVLVLNLVPDSIGSISKKEEKVLVKNGSNFASWYRYISQEQQGKLLDIYSHLREYIDGFDSFRLIEEGKARKLEVGFKNEIDSKVEFFDFEKISEGQKVLIILHTLLEFLPGMGYTLLLDEPENYIALAEIQPWLIELSDRCDETDLQAIIISHHPELIDYLGAEQRIMLDREPLGSTKKVLLPDKYENGVKLSELIARGWIGE